MHEGQENLRFFFAGIFFTRTPGPTLAENHTTCRSHSKKKKKKGTSHIIHTRAYANVKLARRRPRKNDAGKVLSILMREKERYLQRRQLFRRDRNRCVVVSGDSCGLTPDSRMYTRRTPPRPPPRALRKTSSPRVCLLTGQSGVFPEAS